MTASLISRNLYGLLPDGTRAELIVMRNAHGNEVSVTNYGINITDLTVRDRNGDPCNVVLGCRDLKACYEQNAFLNSIVGRFANRIGGGRMKIDGQTVQLPCNEGENHIHGGPQGFHKVLWHIRKAELINKVPTLILEHSSADGDQGYPGKLKCTLTLSWDDSNSLKLDMKASSSAPTHVNMTHHLYFNLSGRNRPAGGHMLRIPAERFTETDSTNLPTGELLPVAGTVMDFRAEKPVAAALDSNDSLITAQQGLDHNFVISTENGTTVREMASLFHPDSGIRMTLSGTQPGVQCYSSQYLNDVRGRDGVRYQPYMGICLEAQHFPDSPNHTHFPSTLCSPEHPYHEQIVWQFSLN